MNRETEDKWLAKSAELMLSPDYKERFTAEYIQVRIRYERLDDMLFKWAKKKLDFEPTCPFELLSDQANMMLGYLRCLTQRAIKEGVDLPDEFKDACHGGYLPPECGD